MTTRIERVRARPLSLPFVTPFQNAKVRYETLSYVWVEATADGVTGRGEVTAMPGYAAETVSSMLAAIEQHMGPAILGMDPFAEQEVEAEIAGALPGNPYARSALDMALVDLRARLMEVPAHRLFGGLVRSEVPLAGIVALSDPPTMAAAAARWVERGAGALQVKLSRDRASSVARVAAVRDRVGPDVTIAVDGNGSFSRIEALRTMEAIAPFGIAFFEQPVAADDIPGMAMLTARGALPVVADECLLTAHDALAIVEARAASGFNIKLTKSGISESRRILAIADAAGLPVSLGSMLETGFGTLAGIQFAAALRQPSFPAELIGPWMVRDTMTRVTPQHGAVELSWRVPEGPGWGEAASTLADHAA